MREEHREETHADMAHMDTQSADGHAGHENHAEMGHASMHHEMKPNVTRPQLAVVGLLTVLALIASVLIPAQFVNLTYSAEEVGGVIMPPGMVMSRDTPADAMREMSAVDPGEVSYSAPGDVRGDQTLEPKIEDGTKVFDLTASVIEWNILPDEQVDAYALNEQVPGPRLRVTEGDRVRINVQNDLPEATSVHWHGLILPNEMDGAADVTQEPIEPGEGYVYEFTAGQPGTYFYHSHQEPDRQQGLGLYGALIVDPADIPTAGRFDACEIEILLYEFKDGLNTYLAGLGPGAAVRSLAELIAFNERERDREMPFFGQDLFVRSEAKGPLTSAAYLKALHRCRRLAGAEGIDAVMDEHRLDALVAATGSPAWPTDLVNGDHFTGASSTPAAVAGYPNVTVPAGFVHGLPVGISFFGRAWSEATLLRLAYAYEQATRHRRPPQMLPTIVVEPPEW